MDPNPHKPGQPAAPFDASFDIKTLNAALNRIKPASPKRASALPVLASAFLAVQDGQARISTTDLDLWLSAPVDIAVGGVDSVILPNFGQLSKFLTQKKTGHVRITSDPDYPTKVTLESGSTTVRLDAADSKEYPLWPKADSAPKVKLNVLALADVLPAASTDESQPILTGVFVDDGTYVATDSHRLHVVRSGESTGNDTMLLPGRAVDVIVKEAAKGSVKHVNARLRDRVDLFVDFPDGFHVQARSIDGEFPNWGPLFSTNPPVAVSWADINEVRSALKEIIQLSKVNVGHNAPFLWKPGDIQGTMAVRDCGEDVIEQRFNGKVHLGGAPAGFNPGYFLTAVEGTTFTEVAGADQLKPWVMEEHAPDIGPAALRQRLLMPVRLS